MIGWMYHWGKQAPEGCPFAGALSIPRELTLAEGKVCNYPVEEARHLLRKESSFVTVTEEGISIKDRLGNMTFRPLPGVSEVSVLEDTRSVEVFANGGQYSFSHWLE